MFYTRNAVETIAFLMYLHGIFVTLFFVMLYSLVSTQCRKKYKHFRLKYWAKDKFYLFMYLLCKPYYKLKWMYHKKHDKYFDPCFLCPYNYKQSAYRGYCNGDCPQFAWCIDEAE